LLISRYPEVSAIENLFILMIHKLCRFSFPPGRAPRRGLEKRETEGQRLRVNHFAMISAAAARFADSRFVSHRAQKTHFPFGNHIFAPHRRHPTHRLEAVKILGATWKGKRSERVSERFML
jgi:hypothetical protein